MDNICYRCDQAAGSNSKCPVCRQYLAEGQLRERVAELKPTAVYMVAQGYALLIMGEIPGERRGVALAEIPARGAKAAAAIGYTLFKWLEQVTGLPYKERAGISL